jgi:uncharacterized damage-inducible protein DinB
MGFEKFQLDTFKNLPKVVGNYISQIEEEKLEVKRAEDAWTIKEHVFHIVDAQDLFLARVKKFLSEQNPVIEPSFPENETKVVNKRRSVKQALAKYRKLRKEQYLLIKNATESDIGKVGSHREYQKYSLPILLHHIIFHDYWHMYRIEEIWLTKDEFFR